MQKLIWLTVFFLIWVRVSQSFAESKPPLPPIDLEAIIAGLAHTESLLKSGRGKLKFYMASYFSRSAPDKEIIVKQVEKGRSRTFSSVEELEFAFSKSYSYFNTDGSKFVADGNIQLVISPQGSISMYLRVAYPPEGLDPRDWGLWYRRQRLSDYLREHKGIQIVGNEKVDDIPCYVVQTPEKSAEDPVVKFWITPESGFRLVQIHHQTQIQKALIKFEWQAYQLDGKQRVWFLKRAVSISTSETGVEPVQNEMEITDFNPNTDVSDLFDLQIPPDTEISSPGFSQSITFEEIGWKQFEENREN